jgi:hypothetical protein
MDALTGIFAEVQDWTPYLLASAGLGTLTMALLQAFKEITPVRRLYQQFRMKNWLKDHAIRASTVHGISVDDKLAEDQLLQLAADGDCNAFYALEIEKLCGQWNAALQVVADYPDVYGALFACMTAQATKQDYILVNGHVVPDPLPPVIEAQLPSHEQTKRLHRRQAFLEAKGRIAHQMQRAVDGFQIAASYQWKWSFQVASYAINFVIVGIGLAIAHTWSPASIIGAAAAGFIAPVARDLLAAIQKLRA